MLAAWSATIWLALGATQPTVLVFSRDASAAPSLQERDLATEIGLALDRVSVLLVERPVQTDTPTLTSILSAQGAVAGVWLEETLSGKESLKLNLFVARDGKTFLSAVEVRSQKGKNGIFALAIRELLRQASFVAVELSPDQGVVAPTAAPAPTPAPAVELASSPQIPNEDSERPIWWGAHGIAEVPVTAAGRFGPVFGASLGLARTLWGPIGAGIRLSGTKSLPRASEQTKAQAHTLRADIGAIYTKERSGLRLHLRADAGLALSYLDIEATNVAPRPDWYGTPVGGLAVGAEFGLGQRWGLSVTVESYVRGIRTQFRQRLDNSRVATVPRASASLSLGVVWH